MFIHTRGSATKRFAKFGRQKRTFRRKKEEKAVSPTQVRQTKDGPAMYQLQLVTY